VAIEVGTASKPFGFAERAAEGVRSPLGRLTPENPGSNRAASVGRSEVVPPNPSKGVVKRAHPRAIAGQTWMKNQRRGATSAESIEDLFSSEVVGSPP
jgi:hypothetical protein